MFSLLEGFFGNPASAGFFICVNCRYGVLGQPEKCPASHSPKEKSPALERGASLQECCRERSAAACGAPTGIAFQAGAVAHQRKVLAFGAGLAFIALHTRLLDPLCCDSG